jgi:hypothetical protein
MDTSLFDHSAAGSHHKDHYNKTKGNLNLSDDMV